jgi:putative SOS response-associated peptidase YedK
MDDFDLVFLEGVASMCGRFTLTADAATLQQEFSLASVTQDLTPRYNIAPSQPVAVVVNQDGDRQLDAFRWGLIPTWAKDPAIGNKMINARGETVAEKPSFKRPFKNQRCLVLADGFYEWRKTSSGKIPMYIHLTDRRPFAFAGLWDRWQPPDGEPIYSCTIITTPPNRFLETIHNRMPVILSPEAIDIWLDPAQQTPEALLPLLKPYPAEAMNAYAVSKLVNAPANDVPECILPVQ